VVKMSPSPLFPPLAPPLEKDPALMKLWFKDLRDIASMIYEVYIQTPDAPLEVNISSEARCKIERTLGISVAGNSNSHHPTAAVTSNEVQGHTHNGGIYGRFASAPAPAPATVATSRIAPDSSTPTSKASCGDVELGECTGDDAHLLGGGAGEAGGGNDRKSSAGAVNQQSKAWGQSSATQGQPPIAAAVSTGSDGSHAHHPHNGSREQVQSNVSDGASLVPRFPDLWGMSVEDAHLTLLEITSVYDEARGIIHKVISSDVFPRFQRTERYRAIASQDDYAAK
jgi:hypothetical protein